jgi:hypothetical protein
MREYPLAKYAVAFPETLAVEEKRLSAEMWDSLPARSGTKKREM